MPAKTSLHNRFRLSAAAPLSVVVILCGFRAFRHGFGRPAAVLWTLAVAGVWATYLIRG